MQQLIECVPNFSEGTDKNKIDNIVNKINLLKIKTIYIGEEFSNSTQKKSFNNITEFKKNIHKF